MWRVEKDVRGPMTTNPFVVRHSLTRETLQVPVGVAGAKMTRRWKHFDAALAAANAANFDEQQKQCSDCRRVEEETGGVQARCLMHT